LRVCDPVPHVFFFPPPIGYPFCTRAFLQGPSLPLEMMPCFYVLFPFFGFSLFHVDGLPPLTAVLVEKPLTFSPSLPGLFFLSPVLTGSPCLLPGKGQARKGALFCGHPPLPLHAVFPPSVCVKSVSFYCGRRSYAAGSPGLSL